MRIVFLGDIVGKAGRKVVLEQMPLIRRKWQLDCIIVNAENAAAGFGITETIANDLFSAGADAITLGNHSFDQRDTLVYIERHKNLVRPVNYPVGTPGRGAALIDSASGHRILVINAMGRVYMDALDDPFAAIDRELEQYPLQQVTDAIIVDFHAEATSEKEAIGFHLDGRVSLVTGTHTHVPTADYRILPEGTAYISDAGMCGDYDSVLGMKKEEPVRRFLQKIPGSRFEPAVNEATLCGIAIETDERTGLATKVAAIRIGPHLEQSRPTFWE